MIKNVIGAVIGAQLAKNTHKVDNGTGAVLGSLAPMVLARLSLPAMIAVGAGGYLLKRHRDKQAAIPTRSAAPMTSANPAPVTTSHSAI